MDKMFLLAESDPDFVYEYAQERSEKLLFGFFGTVVVGIITGAIFAYGVSIDRKNELDLLMCGIPFGLTIVTGLIVDSKWKKTILLRDFAYKKHKKISNEMSMKQNCKAQQFIKENPDILKLATTVSVNEKALSIITKHMDQCGNIDKAAVICELSKSN